MALDISVFDGLKVVVVCGGLSDEREVSLESGKAVFQAIKSTGVACELIELKGDTLEELEGKGFDVIFNAMHGTFGEDGVAQKLFERENICYTGSSAVSCSIAFDKALSKEMFDSSGINTPEWIVLTKDDDPEDVFASLQLPLVFKPVRGGSSQGVTLLKDKEGVKEAFSTALNYDSTGRVMIEKLIDGRELTVGILDDEALPVIELKTPLEFYNYEAKYEAETTEYICPAPLDEDVEQKVKNIALEAFHSLSCHHFARADIMLDKNNIPYVLEVNTIPGFTSHSLLPKAAATAGIDFPSLCLKIIELAKKG